MQLEIAQMLTDAIANATAIAIDNRNKLAALEIALQKYEPNLFQGYLKDLEEVRRRPPTLLSPEGFANLQAKLVQDQH
jgi:hypothetical protein